jgi:hypothetical protein
LDRAGRAAVHGKNVHGNLAARRSENPNEIVLVCAERAREQNGREWDERKMCVKIRTIGAKTPK